MCCVKIDDAMKYRRVEDDAVGMLQLTQYAYLKINDTEVVLYLAFQWSSKIYIACQCVDYTTRVL